MKKPEYNPLAMSSSEVANKYGKKMKKFNQREIEAQMEANRKAKGKKVEEDYDNITTKLAAK